MLTEFAFTPSIFDEQVNENVDVWRSRLERLGDRMFPPGYPCPVIVANLYGGGWKPETSRLIQRIADDRIRRDTMKLFTQIDKVLIDRPIAKDDWPEDQEAWCKEAVAAEKGEPLDRIVACRFAMKDPTPELERVRCISEVRDSGFWSGIPADDSPAMEIGKQVVALSKLAYHSDFLSLITPHINGGSDDESDFAIELIRSTRRKPSSGPTPLVEIHTKGPRDATPGDATFTKYVSAVTGKLARDLGPGFEFTLFFWPKFTDRFVIAGDLTEDAAGNKVKRPRWAVSMNHVARRGDEFRNLPPTEWKLLKSDRVGFLSAIYCKEPVTGYLDVHRVST